MPSDSTWLIELVNVRLELALELGNVGGKGGGGGRSGAVDPPVPIRLDVDAITREVDQLVREIYIRLCELTPWNDYPVVYNAGRPLKFAQKVSVIRSFGANTDMYDCLLPELNALYDTYTRACRLLDLPVN